MQARSVAFAHSSLKGATPIKVVPEKLELVGLAKSTWNRKRFRWVESARSTKKLGSPSGGGVLLSTSEGNRLPTLLGCWKQMDVAEFPVSIFVRSYAPAIAPANLGATISHPPQSPSPQTPTLGYSRTPPTAPHN